MSGTGICGRTPRMVGDLAEPAGLRVIGYVRVSTEEQSRSGAGLAAQRAAIEAACQARGYELAVVLEDAGYSARSLERPAIRAALDELDGRRADALMVSKLDRLSRSLLDFAGLMERSRRRGWALIALDLGVDTATPSGELMANVLASFAAFERRLIGQRTQDALAAKRAAGVRLGRPRALPDDVVARVVDERARGATFRAIADRLNAEGVATGHGGAQWWPATVRDVLASAEREAERDAILAALEDPGPAVAAGVLEG